MGISHDADSPTDTSAAPEGWSPTGPGSCLRAAFRSPAWSAAEGRIGQVLPPSASNGRTSRSSWTRMSVSQGAVGPSGCLQVGHDGRGAGAAQLLGCVGATPRGRWRDRGRGRGERLRRGGDDDRALGLGYRARRGRARAPSAPAGRRGRCRPGRRSRGSSAESFCPGVVTRMRLPGTAEAVDPCDRAGQWAHVAVAQVGGDGVEREDHRIEAVVVDRRPQRVERGDERADAAGVEGARVIGHLSAMT